ncbi:hypothetical protein QT196_11595 [Streptomyces sp. P9-2B-2]|uniref:DUF6801 domain-containing protein n=1 Tax=Streptomyces sp. P9-2B-2 TaxID=3057114 RepID=UPI0025B3692E|nr:DUF6801 domain-containing protein [Streptomyces sp. P9-2B-2]WJY37879.1 hypothetical protein QT196_11595 [Streptomyces sp. P9-2B-2]
MASDKLIQNLREQHRTSRAVPSGPVARRAWGLTMAVGVAGASVGVFGAGPAAADPLSLELRYTCSVLAAHDRPATVKIDSDVPTSAAVARPTPKFVIRAAVPVKAADTKGLRRAGIKTIQGTVEAKVRVTAPEGDTNLRVPFHVARTHVPESGPFLVKATGAAPSRTFSQPGRAKITIGDLTVHVTASGVMTVKLDVPCKLDPRQHHVVASLGITGKGTTAGPDPSGTAETATSGTTGSQSPGGGGRAGATTEGPAGPSANLATTGSQGTTRLIALAAGTVVLGTMAVAAAFRFRSRSR